MQRPVLRRRGLAALAMLLGLGLTIPAPALAAPKVVATIKPIHALVAAIMKDVGDPALLVDGAASPHSFSLKPSDARRVNNADVLFRVSADLEPFTVKLVASLPRSVKVVSLQQAPGLTLLEKRTGGTFETHRHGGKGHDHGHETAKDTSRADAHIWLDPANARAMADEIARVLTAASPADAARIAANTEALKARLDVLAAELDRDLKPLAGRPFVVLHDAYQYLEARFGLTAAGSITVSPDVQPSARRLSELKAKIARLGAVCVFAEPQYRGGLIATVTEGTKARAGVLDPEATALEPGPELYFELMRRLASSIAGCLAG